MQIRDWELRRGRARMRLLRGPLLGLVARGWTRDRVLAHLDDVRSHRTGNGWFGLKLHRHHLERWFQGDPAALGVERWVWLRREDRVAQAVSWARALQTGRWASHQRALLPPVYSRHRIQGLLDRIERGESAWEATLRGRAVLEMSYEELVADLPAALSRVLAHLGVEAPVSFPAPDLQRQGDQVSAAWIERFRAGA